ncbi:MAG: ABC transporter permease [Acidobacteriota bacterium]|nr:ABC transporter permease [Acidobacteriota bacterium]
MSNLEAIRIALQSLWANKLRSVLTLLGVVIGVAAVIAVVTFVNGINSYVAEKVFNLGADVFIVSKMPNVITNIDQLTEGQKRKDITLEDYRAVLEGCRHCSYIGASVNNSNGHIRYGEQSSSDTGVRGWTPSMASIYDLDVVEGRFLTQTDMNTAAHVVIIGADIMDNLMKGVDPVGKEIRIDGQSYTIVGLAKRQGKTLGQSRDNWVMMPISSWQRQYGAHNTIRIWGKAAGVGQTLASAMEEVRVILRSRRHDALGKPDSFDLDTNQSFLSLWASISDNIFAVTIALASISLIIGGIVIMNIMLVSVTERTREIGIRKALGARKTDVLRQFLIEACILAVIGGMFGVVLGFLVAETVTLVIGMPSRIELWAVVAALVVSASVGIFFGVYPARKAANLDPIAALRFEL